MAAAGLHLKMFFSRESHQTIFKLLTLIVILFTMMDVFLKYFYVKNNRKHPTNWPEWIGEQYKDYWFPIRRAYSASKVSLDRFLTEQFGHWPAAIQKFYIEKFCPAMEWVDFILSFISFYRFYFGVGCVIFVLSFLLLLKEGTEEPTLVFLTRMRIAFFGWCLRVVRWIYSTLFPK